MLGEKIAAEQAEEWGLIYKAVEDAALMDEAMALRDRGSPRGRRSPTRR